MESFLKISGLVLLLSVFALHLSSPLCGATTLTIQATTKAAAETTEATSPTEPALKTEGVTDHPWSNTTDTTADLATTDTITDLATKDTITDPPEDVCGWCIGLGVVLVAGVITAVVLVVIQFCFGGLFCCRQNSMV